MEYAWKLLRVAKFSTSPFQRHKAIKNLSNVELEEWEFQFLAQYCDPSLAVSLTRALCNPNLITKPRQYGTFKSNCEIIAAIKSMYDCMKDNRCVKFILETASSFEGIKDVDDGAHFHELHSHENDHILESLEQFVHLTTHQDLSLRIAEHGGLDILLDIWKNFQDNFEIKMILAKIVTNMTSSHDRIVDYFYKSGWIYLLSNWQQDDDLRFQVFASTSLNNLDKYDTSEFKYQPKLYPLYPRGRVNEKPALDLIFVHGILGGIWITWRVQRKSDMLDVGKAPEIEEALKNSFYQEEGIFRHEKIVQMEPGPASKILTITEQTTKNVLGALNEMAEDNLSSEDVSFCQSF